MQLCRTMRQHYIKELKIPKTVKEACEVLGISGKLIQKEISKAYKKLSLMHHPDKQSDCDENSKDLANTNMKALSEAKTLLINALENTTKYNKKAYNKGESETSNKQDVKPTIANSFINKNLERARKLIKQKGKNIPLAPFVKNACEDNRWCELFEEFLSKWSGEIDLNTNIIIVSDTFKSIEGTVLYYACIQRSRSVVELLLKHKADVNKVSYHSYKVPICSALKDNDHDLVSLLFQYGAKIDVTAEVEQKIIDNCCSKYTKETMEVLLRYTSSKQNTEILKRFSDSNTSTSRDIEIVQLLLNKETNLNYGAIQAAVAKGNTQLVPAGQLENLQPLTIVQGTTQPNEETTIPPTIEEVNSRSKEVLTYCSSDNTENQEKEVEITQDSADINNNQVAGKGPQASVNTQTTSSKTYIISVGCWVLGVVLEQ